MHFYSGKFGSISLFGLLFLVSLSLLIQAKDTNNYDSEQNNQIDKNSLNIGQAEEIKFKKAPNRKSRPQVVNQDQKILSQNIDRQYLSQKRRSRVLNIADNWEKIPYILQTYK